MKKILLTAMIFGISNFAAVIAKAGDWDDIGNSVGCTALESGVNTACSVTMQNIKNEYSRDKEGIKATFIKCKEDANNNNPSDKSARKIAVNACKTTKKDELGRAKTKYKAKKETQKPLCREAKRKLRDCRKK